MPGASRVGGSKYTIPYQWVLFEKEPDGCASVKDIVEESLAFYGKWLSCPLSHLHIHSRTYSLPLISASFSKTQGICL